MLGKYTHSLARNMHSVILLSVNICILDTLLLCLCTVFTELHTLANTSFIKCCKFSFAHANLILSKLRLKDNNANSVLDKVLGHLKSKNKEKAREALIDFRSMDTNTFAAGILRGEVQQFSLKTLETSNVSDAEKEVIRKSMFTCYANAGVMSSLIPVCIGRALYSFFGKNLKEATADELWQTIENINSCEFKYDASSGGMSPMAMAYHYAVKDQENLELPESKQFCDDAVNERFYSTTPIGNEPLRYFKWLKAMADQPVFYIPNAYVYGEAPAKTTASEAKTIQRLRTQAQAAFSAAFNKYIRRHSVYDDDWVTPETQKKVKESLDMFLPAISTEILRGIFPEPETAVQEQSTLNEIYLKTSNLLHAKVSKIVEQIPNPQDVSNKTIDVKMQAIYEHVFGATHATGVKDLVSQITDFTFISLQLQVNEHLIQPLKILHDTLLYHLRIKPSVSKHVTLQAKYNKVIKRNPLAAATVLCIHKVKQILSSVVGSHLKYTKLWPDSVPNGTLLKPSPPVQKSAINAALEKLKTPTNFTRDSDYTKVFMGFARQIHSYLSQLNDYQDALKAADPEFSDSSCIPFKTDKKSTSNRTKKRGRESEKLPNYCFKFWMNQCSKDYGRKHVKLTDVPKADLEKLAKTMKKNNHKKYRKFVIDNRKDIDFDAALTLSDNDNSNGKRQKKASQKPCFAFAQGECTKDNCKFSHDDAVIAEFKKLLEERSKQPCRSFSASGSCKFGHACQFKHSRTGARAHFAKDDVRYQLPAASEVSSSMNAVIHQRSSTPHQRTVVIATASATATDIVTIDGVQYRRV